MPLLTIERGESSESRCACCGGTTRVVRGFVSADGNARAVYLVRWAPGRPEHDATVAVSVGAWGDSAAASNRECFVLRHHRGDSGPGFMLVDGVDTPWASHGGFLGRMLSRAEGLASPQRDEVFAILDAAGEQDDRLHRWWLDHSSTPAH